LFSLTPTHITNQPLEQQHPIHGPKKETTTPSQVLFRVHSPDRRPDRNWAAASYSTLPNPIAPAPLECGCSNCSHWNVVVLLMTIIIPRHIHRPPLSLHQSIQQEKKATTLSNSLTRSLARSLTHSAPPPSVDDANLLGSNCRVHNL
jgi:hypothetical protein